ncbi:MAG TPA: hypothetical protein VN604_12145 [Nitrospirota bacterium]|nr:hypothetical protein [Nitrospirota bacterium]
MSNKEKPLPKPPSRAFGAHAPDQEGPLLSDRMAAAIAEGRLEEFLKEELPDNEHARSLAMMMLGMTGMLPPGSGRPAYPPQEREEKPLQAAGEMAGDVLQAVQGGDVKGLMDMLRREHQKRTPGAEADSSEKAPSSQPVDQPVIDKEIIDALIKIASDNSVSMDWIILRAIKLYVEEYSRTGRL